MKIPDVLPMQDHYYLLSDGTRFAKHGTESCNGVLVFTNLERAEQFRITVRKAMNFEPCKITPDQLLAEAQKSRRILSSRRLTGQRVPDHTGGQNMLMFSIYKKDLKDMGTGVRVRVNGKWTTLKRVGDEIHGFFDGAEQRLRIFHITEDGKLITYYCQAEDGSQPMMLGADHGQNN